VLEEVGCIRHNGIKEPVVEKTNVVSTWLNVPNTNVL
jgi:hypothetical protein